jgi:hypothetical protein
MRTLREFVDTGRIKSWEIINRLLRHHDAFYEGLCEKKDEIMSLYKDETSFVLSHCPSLRKELRCLSHARSLLMGLWPELAGV